MRDLCGHISQDGTRRRVNCVAVLGWSVSGYFGLICAICLKRDEVCATFRNHD